MENLGAALDHPVLREFYDYWRSLSPPGRLPSRQRFEPLSIAKLLPWVFMIDVVSGPPDPAFRYRLAGTGITTNYGFDFTGKTVHEAFPERATALIADYADVVVHRRPNHRTYTIPVPGKDYRTVERLTCPLASDGERVDILVGALGFA